MAACMKTHGRDMSALKSGFFEKSQNFRKLLIFLFCLGLELLVSEHIATCHFGETRNFTHRQPKLNIRCVSRHDESIDSVCMGNSNLLTKC